jgi:hypothetical protein
MIISCKKDDNNNNKDETISQTASEVFEEISKTQKISFDLAPVELPAYAIQADDSMRQEIKNMVNLINQFYKRSVFPPDTLFNIKKSTASAEVLSMNEVNRNCFNLGEINECIYEWTENKGKLQVKYTTIYGGTQIPSTITEEWKGTDGNGVKYDDWFTAYLSMLAPDNTWSKQVWYTKSFEPYNPEKCEECAWWELQTYVEDNGTLRFLGEEKKLVTYRYVTIRYECGILEEYEYPILMKELTVYPDGRLEFVTHIYSLRIKYLFRWIIYSCSPDGSWSKRVYDDYGNLINEEHWPA